MLFRKSGSTGYENTLTLSFFKGLGLLFRVRVSRRGMYICDIHVRLTSVDYPQFRRGRKLDPTVGAVSVVMVGALLILVSHTSCGHYLTDRNFNFDVLGARMYCFNFSSGASEWYRLAYLGLCH